MNKNKVLLVSIFMLMVINFSLAQLDSAAKNGGTKIKREMPAEYTVTKQKTAQINGQNIKYNVTHGTLPVFNKENKPIAYLFYVYYERNDISNKANRPIIFSFNGGPGSASVWMHIGYTSPKVLQISDEGYPIQPYGMKDNPNSILDIADIVFIDPVNTGFSRIIDEKEPVSTFFGVNADVKYLADWVSNFVTKNNRWTSPKYLIGESYGTTRVSGLALELQTRQWMYLNGVILVSPTDLGIRRDGPVDDGMILPYFAATAWYHKALKKEYLEKDLIDFLPEVENFTLNEFIPALIKGNQLSQEKTEQLAEKFSLYSGLSKKVILQHNLRVPTYFFWKELLRDKGFTVGRLDSRYLGLDVTDAGDQPESNSELIAWLHAFTPAINFYLREELNVSTLLNYNMLVSVQPWDNSHNYTGQNLAKAMVQNPFLHLLVQSGYYDGACDYFNAKYNMWQMDPAGKLKNRMFWKGYRSGHMMYLRKEDLKTSNQDLREFILQSTPKNNSPADYK